MANAEKVTIIDPITGKAAGVNSSGELKVDATLNTGDIEIGAVEIKNAVDDTRAVVTAGNLALGDAALGVTLKSGAPVANAAAIAVKSQLVGARFGTFPGAWIAGDQGALLVDQYGALITGPDSLPIGTFPSSSSPATVTISIASPAVITMANNFVAGQTVTFATTGALPTGLTAGTSYYVIATGLTTSSFQVSATVGGAAVNTSGSQSGVHTLTGVGISVASAATIFTQDMTGYLAVYFSFTSAGSGNTVTVESSDDNAQWETARIIRTDNSTSTASNSATSIATTQSFAVPRSGRWTRVRVSTYGSGTITLTGYTSKTPVIYSAIYTAGTIGSGATDSGNPVKIGGVYNSTLPTFTNGQRGDLQIGTRGSLNVTWFGQDGTTSVAVGTPADGQSVTAAARTQSFGMYWNGATEDLARSVTNGTNSTGTGIAAAGILAQLDDVSPTVPTENQFANLRMSPARALLVDTATYSYGRATADTQIKASAGFVHSISIAALTATPTAGLLTVYDNTAESGTVIYSEWIFATDVGHTITLDVAFATGLYIGFDATLANVQATVAYR